MCRAMTHKKEDQMARVQTCNKKAGIDQGLEDCSLMGNERENQRYDTHGYGGQKMQYSGGFFQNFWGEVFHAFSGAHRGCLRGTQEKKSSVS